MINKLELQSVINKYFLNGMVESVKWTTENNALDIDFQSPNKDMIGRVKHTNFPLENSVIAVYDTSKLNKLLGITSGEVVLELEKTQAVYTKLIISDFNYTLNFSLTDLLLIQDLGNVTDPNNYEITGTLDEEKISAIIKAHNALESDNMIVRIGQNLDGEDCLILTFGDNSNHTNKIDYQFPDASLNNVAYGTKTCYNADMMWEVIDNANSSLSSSPKIPIKELTKKSITKED